MELSRTTGSLSPPPAGTVAAVGTWMLVPAWSGAVAGALVGTAVTLAAFGVAGDRRLAPVAAHSTFLGIGVAGIVGGDAAARSVGAVLLALGVPGVALYLLRARVGNLRRLAARPVDAGIERRIVCRAAEGLIRIRDATRPLAAVRHYLAFGVGMAGLGTTGYGVASGSATVALVGLGAACLVALVPFYHLTDWRGIDGRSPETASGVGASHATAGVAPLVASFLAGGTRTDSPTRSGRNSPPGDDAPVPAIEPSTVSPESDGGGTDGDGGAASTADDGSQGSVPRRTSNDRATSGPADRSARPRRDRDREQGNDSPADRPGRQTLATTDGGPSVVRPVAGSNDGTRENDTDYVATSPSNPRSDRPTDPNVGRFVAPAPRTHLDGSQTTGENADGDESGTTADPTTEDACGTTADPTTEDACETTADPTTAGFPEDDAGSPPIGLPEDAPERPPAARSDDDPGGSNLVRGDLFQDVEDTTRDGENTREDGIDDSREDGVDDDWIDWTAEVSDRGAVDDDWLERDADDDWADRFESPDA